MTTPYGFVDAVAEQVRLRCMGSSTPHGYEVASQASPPQASPPPARVRQRLLVHNWVGEEDVGCCQSGTTEQMWAGVAPSAMRICVTNRCETKQRGLPTILVWGLQRLQAAATGTTGRPLQYHKQRRRGGF